jgi:hypothetical protein
MISFGDLLTLLVCFFLVLTPSLTSSASAKQGDQQVSSPTVSQALGTGLASTDARYEHGSDPASLVSAPKALFLLRRGTQIELPGQLREFWEEVANSSRAKAVKVSVGLCDVEAYEEVVASVRRELPSGKRAKAPEIVSRQFEIGAECAGDQLAREAMVRGELVAVIRFEDVLRD